MHKRRRNELLLYVVRDENEFPGFLVMVDGKFPALRCDLVAVPIPKPNALHLNVSKWNGPGTFRSVALPIFSIEVVNCVGNPLGILRDGTLFPEPEFLTMRTQRFYYAYEGGSRTLYWHRGEARHYDIPAELVSPLE